MKLNSFLKMGMVVLALLHFSACNKAAPAAASSTPAAEVPVTGLTNGTTLTSLSGVNVMSLTVNGSNCSAGSYANKPCASVTICNPGTNTCQTVNDLLVDTGSYGLRVFKSAISNLTLTQVTSKQGGALAECAKFGDGSSEWGPVKIADVVMGGEAAVQIPIQVLDSSFGTVPTSCGTPDASPSAAGFNGILGVGLYSEDCGAGCIGSHISNGMYFSCTGGNSGIGSGTAACPGGSTNTTSDQVQNPVSAQAIDNNGVAIMLPSISSSGAVSVDGYLVLGIGTRSNNIPSGVTTFQVDPSSGEFTTTFNGTSYSGFTDTGSNGLYFDGPTSLANCSATSAWFCPASVTTLSAVNTGYGGQGSGTVDFQIGNAATFFSSSNSAFNDLGGDGGAMFDFGLPFFFGRNVYVGIENKVSSLGTGPLWAY